MRYSQFADATAHAFAITKVAKANSVEPHSNPCPRLSVSQPFQPISERVSTLIRQVFKQFNLGVTHGKSVAQKLQNGKVLV
jgi:hypothetical protein